MAEVVLPSNSDEARKKKTPVIKGKAHVREASIGRKIRDQFISEDAGTIKDFIIYDVIVPSIRDAIGDILHGSVDRIFGTTSRTRNSRYSRLNRQIDYNKISSGRRDYISDRRPQKSSYQEIVLDSRADCEEVITELINTIDEYGFARVSDLFELVGYTSDHTDVKWGWDNLSSAQVRRVRDGYLLDLPRAKQL